MLNQVVGNYRITEKISEGGMGVVYRAEHTLIGRAAAVKVLRPEWLTNREVVTRFFNEARATTSIRHPGIVELFDFGYCSDGQAYIVMELLLGESLAQRLARVGRLGEIPALTLMRGVVSALAAAHAQGIVHRDLKPDNIFLVSHPDMPTGERPKLLDFGIAKLADARSSSGKTRTGMMMGTPAYMSPEQCRGAGEVDHRSDFYAIGCILYELLVGEPPFVSEGQGEIIGAHLFMEPVPVRSRNPTVTPEVDAIVARLLAKDAGKRPQTAAELLAALGRLSQPPAAGAMTVHVAAADQGAAMQVGAPTLAVPTTLGGAAGVSAGRVPTYVKPRRARWVSAGLVIAAAGGLALYATFGRGGTAEDGDLPFGTFAASAVPAPRLPPPPTPPPLPVIVKPEVKPEIVAEAKPEVVAAVKPPKEKKRPPKPPKPPVESPPGGGDGLFVEDIP